MGSRGPVPDQDALRRNRPSDQASWTTLPSAGRAGDPPAWPLPHQTARERKRWAIEWAKPQAVMWEAEGVIDEVAHFVRVDVLAEQPDASNELRKVRDARAKSLGLTLDSMLRLRWRVGDVASPSRPQRSTPRSEPGARDRLRVVGE